MTEQDGGTQPPTPPYDPTPTPSANTTPQAPSAPQFSEPTAPTPAAPEAPTAPLFSAPAASAYPPPSTPPASEPTAPQYPSPTGAGVGYSGSTGTSYPNATGTPTGSAFPGATGAAPTTPAGSGDPSTPGMSSNTGATYSDAAAGSQPPQWSAPMGAPGSYPGPSDGTDGVALASLITGVLGTGPVALVLGIIGLKRTGPGQKGGRGFAIAGTVLGGLGMLGWIIVAILMITAVNTVDNAIEEANQSLTDLNNEYTAEYAEGCRSGDMMDCDTLYVWAEPGSEEETLAETCNGRGDRSEHGSCYALGNELDKPSSYGDDAEMDALYDSCKSGDMAACDDLYYEALFDSPDDSEYLEFSSTCGNLTTAEDGSGLCQYQSDLGATGGSSDSADALDTYDSTSGVSYEEWLQLVKNLASMGGTPEASQTYGDNSVLDVWWDSCAEGADSSCMTLWLTSAEGSNYRAHAASCGGRGAQPGVCSF
ncbi:DUF4190 domain-containing protein [Cellulomonas sp. NPDC089187]|uniref:DUF4190 domain-containing protein n=1 Tax=Cellulomonas sp. NPDC089187 TaxID=3154970 RepID=UPI003428E472